EQCIEFEGNKNYFKNLSYINYKPFQYKENGYLPLVYAIAGVDGSDVMLTNARPKSTTRIVAPGAFGVGITPPGTPERVPEGDEIRYESPQATVILTGSSVSAALVSASAALVWAFEPKLSPAQVTQAIYDNGIKLEGGPTDTVYTCLGGKECKDSPSRLSVCQTLTALCANGEGSCLRKMPSCIAPGPFKGAVSRLDRTAYNALFMQHTNFISNYYRGMESTAGVREPNLQSVYNLTRLGPQPPVRFCPTCHFKTFQNTRLINVMMKVDKEFPSSILNPYLTLYDAEGRVLETVSLNLNIAVPGQSYYQQNIETHTLAENISTVEINGSTSETSYGYTPIAFTVSQPLPMFVTVQRINGPIVIF
ncbi:MAG: S8 family serine peptidase, partial [Myxococcota bacterium]|nr:S8 family serine peptidase [Myxococcota bacterium]